jgi:branched-chain amino acid transport system ATP-binding protein
MALLEVENIYVNYGRLAALRGISLSVDEGEVVCILGPNGAGKSTTLQAIAGGVRPHSGGIRFDGVPLAKKTPESICRLGIAIVPEGRHVFATLSVDENLRIGSYQRSDKSRVVADLERMLELFPILKDRLKQPAGRLSGGEQQMLVICRALMTKPRLMLIDEPSLGLAPQVIDRVYDTLLSVRKTDRVTLLINEQSSERMLKVANRIYVIRSGSIRLHGPAAELRDGRAVMSAYFGFEDNGTPRPNTSPTLQ